MFAKILPCSGSGDKRLVGFTNSIQGIAIDKSEFKNIEEFRFRKIHSFFNKMNVANGNIGPVSEYPSYFLDFGKPFADSQCGRRTARSETDGRAILTGALISETINAFGILMKCIVTPLETHIA